MTKTKEAITHIIELGKDHERVNYYLNSLDEEVVKEIKLAMCVGRRLLQEESRNADLIYNELKNHFNNFGWNSIEIECEEIWSNELRVGYLKAGYEALNML